ncbi:ImmA/IrrE family metallo-endopeptidase [Bacillus sp. JJ1566]|uniref:ImmA/IrrE family metallo-endopeptidase n=1 Tax=Bacillus sp. JJ1566 TaxID=3122961 RepID=UPI002FFF0ACD
MSVYIANPTSRKKIRMLTNSIRQVVGMFDENYFPVVEFLELVLPKLYPSFSYEIISSENMKNEYGLTLPEKDIIRLREDVYENAISGIGRDRFTIAHEIGHYFMHKPGSISLARNTSVVEVPKFKEPEWQANTFAGELLAPPHIIRGLSVKEVALSCGISLEVASIQLKNINK